MQDFNTSLLREKFVIKPENPAEADIVALSNRMVISLVSDDGLDNETIIVRTQNMHSCARMAAVIVKEFYDNGAIMTRAMPLSWKMLWGDVIKGYEKDWNPKIWCAIYFKGRLVYHDGEHHPFLDIIEQCDAANKNDYSKSLAFAEAAFSKAGKKVKIEHDSNVALVVSNKSEKAKCGIIVRAANGTTTFNYTAVPRESANARSIHPFTTLTVSAAFLESVQLAFQIGLMNRKKQYKLIDKHSDEDRKHRRAISRMANLNKAIANYEQNFSVQYRPDRPTLTEMVDKAEGFAIKLLKAEIEAKMAEGVIPADEWIE